MIMQRAATSINWTLSILLLVVFAIQGYWLASYLGRDAPIEILSVYANPPIIKEGDPLIITYKIIRQRLCQTESDRIFLTENNVVVWRERVAGSFTIVASQPQEISVRTILPTNGEFAPGDYISRGTIYSNCGINDFHAIQRPDVHFKIVPRE